MCLVLSLLVKGEREMGREGGNQPARLISRNSLCLGRGESVQCDHQVMAKTSVAVSWVFQQMLLLLFWFSKSPLLVRISHSVVTRASRRQVPLC